MLSDLSQIETVLLDMDGTLLDLHYDNFFWQHEVPRLYAQKNSISEDQAVAYLRPIFESNAGTLNWYCVNFWSEQLGFDVMQFKAEIAHKIAWRPQAQLFLNQCQEHVADTRLVTNGHRKVLDLKMIHTGIDQYFSEMICSHELGAAKESQDFWHRLQEQKQFDPERTLFIDDSENVLDSANKFGIRHVYSVAEPDSVKPRMTESKYPMLEGFPGV